jgi:tyrosinase
LIELSPFWRTQSSYWNSKDIQTASSLHYTYPELLGDPTPDQVALRVIKLYGGGTLDPGPVKSPQTLHPSTQSNSITRWSARVRSKQFEVGGSFSVLIFLGNVPENSREWLTSSTYVGSFHALVNRTPEMCANCQTQADVGISGVVHLNEAIVKTHDSDNQASLHPDYVVPRLTKELSWRVLKASAFAVVPPKHSSYTYDCPCSHPDGWYGRGPARTTVTGSSGDGHSPYVVSRRDISHCRTATALP